MPKQATGYAINPDALRIFCRNHGGQRHVANTLGVSMSTINHSIRNKYLSRKVMDKLCSTYAENPDYFCADSAQVRPEEEPEESDMDIVTELIEAAQAKPETVVVHNPDPFHAEKAMTLDEFTKWTKERDITGKKSPEEKTIAELTGDDLCRLVMRVVRETMNELLQCKVVVGVEKKGGRYGW